MSTPPGCQADEPFARKRPGTIPRPVSGSPLVIPADIASLRATAHTRETHVTIRRLTLLTLLDEIERLGEVADRDRVIARLLDGWWPLVNHGEWIREDLEQPDVSEPMSDGEAAIIRQHQEKAQ